MADNLNEEQNANQNKEEEIKKLLEQNLKMTQEIFKMTRSMKRYIAFQKFMSLIYFLLIVVPLILGVIYLPPLLSKMIRQYQDILGTSSSAGVTDIFKGGLPSLGSFNLNQQNLGNLNLNSIK